MPYGPKYADDGLSESGRQGRREGFLLFFFSFLWLFEVHSPVGLFLSNSSGARGPPVGPTRPMNRDHP